MAKKYLAAAVGCKTWFYLFLFNVARLTPKKKENEYHSCVTDFVAGNIAKLARGWVEQQVLAGKGGKSTSEHP